MTRTEFRGSRVELAALAPLAELCPAPAWRLDGSNPAVPMVQKGHPNGVAFLASRDILATPRRLGALTEQ